MNLTRDVVRDHGTVIGIPTTNLAMQQMGDDDDDDTAEVMRRGDDAEEREGDAVKPEA